MATLGEVMSREVITIEPFDTIGHAAEKMVAEGVSVIVVSDGGRLIGIVTERDLTRAVAGRVHSSQARVREWMTADPKVVSSRQTRSRRFRSCSTAGSATCPWSRTSGRSGSSASGTSPSGHQAGEVSDLVA